MRTAVHLLALKSRAKARSMWKSLLILFVSHSALAVELAIPAFTAYGDPDFDDVRRTKEGDVTRWGENGQRLLWFGELKTTGDLLVKVNGNAGEGRTAELQMTVTLVGAAAQGSPQKASLKGSGSVDFGKLAIAKAGYYQFALSLDGASGNPPPKLSALVLDGPATTGAHFSTVERRNAASVHMGYPVPKGTDVAWFYNEDTVRTEPIYSFYMACGFNRGYFGIQVNHPKERRIIFSVWDSGNEGIDRKKVADENRVKLLAKGEGVDAGDFGHEGTGGHSHLVYPWKGGETYRFLLGAQPDGTTTTYTAYFWFPEKKDWGLIASFCAPKDGKWLHGLHSFNENFGGSNGHLQRLAEYGPQWILSKEGQWTELRRATFSHDGHGEEMRLDYAMGVKGPHFYLSNGGWIGEAVKYGDPFDRPSSGTQPPAAALDGVKKFTHP